MWFAPVTLTYVGVPVGNAIGEGDGLGDGLGLGDGEGLGLGDGEGLGDGLGLGDGDGDAPKPVTVKVVVRLADPPGPLT